MEEACPRAGLLQEGAEANHILNLLEVGAFTDAALALVKLELPAWTVRRLQFDGGEWHCALSQHRDLPDWLDDAKEARHADLASAILLSLLEARAVTPPSIPIVGQSYEGSGVGPCCEKFS